MTDPDPTPDSLLILLWLGVLAVVIVAVRWALVAG